MVCLASLALSAWIVGRWPVLYWFDGYNRLANRDLLLVWRWLPLLQAVILAASEWARDAAAVRLVLALVATGAIAGGYALAAQLAGRAAGLVAAVWIAGNALFVALATVPYQEALFAAQLFTILALAHRPDAAGGLAPLPGRGRLVAIALLVGLACANRYEGWLILAVVTGEAALRAWRSSGWWPAVQRAALVFLAFGGVLVVLWLWLADIEVTRHESAVTERLGIGALLGTARNLGGELVRKGLVAVFLAGLGGIALAVRDRAARTTHLRVAAFVVPYLALLFLTGSPGPQRQAYLPMLLLAVYAAYGSVRAIEALARRLSSGRARRALQVSFASAVLALAIVGALQGVRLTRGCANGNADMVRIQKAAAWLRPRLDDSALLVACNELERRGVSVHAWMPLERVLNAARMPALEVGDLRALLAEAGSVFLVRTDEPGDPLGNALRRMRDDGDARASGLSLAVLEGMPDGAAEVWHATLDAR